MKDSGLQEIQLSLYRRGNIKLMSYRIRRVKINFFFSIKKNLKYNCFYFRLSSCILDKRMISSKRPKLWNSYCSFSLRFVRCVVPTIQILIVLDNLYSCKFLHCQKTLYFRTYRNVETWIAAANKTDFSIFEWRKRHLVSNLIIQCFFSKCFHEYGIFNCSFLILKY